jgi:hypothetical protein
MAERLTERFALGEEVEILVADIWRPGIVVAKEHPAIWVRTANGQPWFVTNGKRIRKLGTGSRE